MQRLTLTPPARERAATDILVGADAVQELPSLLKKLKPDACVVLYDSTVKSIAERVTSGLGDTTIVSISVKSGEESKSLTEVERITSLLLKENCTRHTVLVCVGGGMLTDLGGFVASVFMRGIPCILIPTTLLGMADAAIGGKTAVNAGSRKNMIGSTTHPAAVIADTGLLQGLPEAQLKEGMVEILKIAAMCDANFFTWIEKNLKKILARDTAALEECTARAIELKIKIVEGDEHDRTARLLLNFGHTIGHAVEALSLYSISHAAAVAIGMVAEVRAIESVETRDSRVSTTLVSLIQTLGYSIEIPKKLKPDAMWEAMLVDKKTVGGTVRVAVPVILGMGEVMPLSSAQFHSLFR